MTLSTRIAAVLLLAAAVTLGLGVVERSGDTDSDVIERAIRAPITDVGIEPIGSAVTFWQARAAADPTDYISHTRAATSLMAQARETGDASLYEDAEQMAERALAANPHDAGSILARGAAKAATHDFAGAAALARRVLERDASSTAALLALSDAHFELGDYAAAARGLEDVRRLLDGDGAQAAVRSRLAREAALRGRWAEATDHAARALLSSAGLDLRRSEAAFYRFQLAHVLYDAGRVDDAGRALAAALRVEPSHLPSLELQGQVLVAQNRIASAVQVYERLVERTPAADLHGALAKLYEVQGRRPEAAEQRTRGLSAGRVALATMPAERRHLAAFFADADPPAALAAATADFETRKDVGAYDALAWALYRNGRYDEAAEYVDEMLAPGGGDASLLYHAGMIELGVGRTAQARSLLTEALARNPRFDVEHAPLARAALRSIAGGFSD